MIDVVTSCLAQLIEVSYVPHMFVTIAALGLVNIIKRMITMNL